MNGVADDLAAIVSRKRSRKISTNSTASRRSLKWEDGILDTELNEGRVRASSASRVAQSNTATASASPNHVNHLGSIRSHSLRSHRVRTSSISSLTTSHHRSASLASAALPIRSLLPDNSQVALERIINSRLVETFITVTISPLESTLMKDISGPSPMSVTVPSRSPSNSRPATNQTLPNSSSQKSASKPIGPLKKPSTSTSPSKRRFIPAETSAKILKPVAPTKQDRKLNGTSHSLSSSRKGKSMVNLALEPDGSPEIRSPPPVYFSPIHRPSTNPFFPIDTRLNQAHWLDTSGQNLKVEIWGKMPIRTEYPTRLDELEGLPEDQNFKWKLLDEWNVDLDRLTRLPNDVQTIFSSPLLTDW